MSWFYLHGNAETLNEFDCCEGNINAFRKELRNHKDTCIEESEKKYMYEKYPEIKKIITEYNHKH